MPLLESDPLNRAGHRIGARVNVLRKTEENGVVLHAMRRGSEQGRYEGAELSLVRAQGEVLQPLLPARVARGVVRHVR